MSVTGASNVTGEVWPVEAIARLAHRYGARVALDAAQLAAHRPIDIADWDVDYVAFSGHKVYAPYGAGVLAGRADWLDAAEPYLAGGGATRRVTAGAVEWNTGPARHEGGTPAALGAFALAAAVRALEDAGWDELLAHEEALLERLLTGLDAIDGVRTYELWGRGHDRVGVVSFNVAGLNPALLAAALGGRARHRRPRRRVLRPSADGSLRRAPRRAREHRRRHDPGRHRPAARSRRADRARRRGLDLRRAATAPSCPIPTRGPALRSADCSADRSWSENRPVAATAL